jgi:hypothetical protein
MKAFIERCRSRGKDGSHTKTVCDMHGSVLACEVALTSSNTTAALEENPASGTTRSGTIQCRHEGCLKIFQTNSNRNKHERSHSLRIADDNLSPKRQRIETKLFSPTESIRDKRLDAHRALGWQAFRDVRDQNITQVSNSSISKLKFAQSGVMAFGTVSYLLFKNKVASKMGQIFPNNLASFAIEGSDVLAKERGLRHESDSSLKRGRTTTGVCCKWKFEIRN